MKPTNAARRCHSCGLDVPEGRKESYCDNCWVDLHATMKSLRLMPDRGDLRVTWMPYDKQKSALEALREAADEEGL